MTIEIGLDWYYAVGSYLLAMTALYWGFRKCVKLLNRS
mgnify:CR=1 FL=1